MSLATDSPLHSSSSGSDDFAAFLNDELDSYSDTSPEAEEEDDDYGSDNARVKRQKVDILESVKDPQSSALQNVEQIIESRAKELCSHPGSIRGMCLRCGEKVDDDDDAGVANHGSTLALKYIHKDLRLGNDEIARLRNRDFKNLLRHKKLYLVLDLDHTLLNSTRFQDIVQDEEYLMSQAGSLQDASTSRGSLFRLDFMRMATKLRPFVHTFLKEASSLFEMYIYTMGERAYALEMAKLLDPEKVYFSSRVIAQDDCTQRHQKGLDVVLGQESAVLILDDTESVWSKHRENLILMERYHYFASSCRQFGFKSESLSQRKTDENESDGALASILKVLKQIHSMFFDTEPGVDFADRDVRQVMSSVRKEILKGCKVVFSGVFPTNDDNIAERHHLWKIAERLGAMCVKEVDPSVTHVISIDAGTEKSRWAVKQKKFLVNPVWIEAANYFWEKKPEDNFPVALNHPKKSQ